MTEAICVRSLKVFYTRVELELCQRLYGLLYSFLINRNLSSRALAKGVARVPVLWGISHKLMELMQIVNVLSMLI